MTLGASLPTGDPAGLSIDGRRRIQAGMVARAADGTPRVGVIPVHYSPLVTGRASELGYDVGPFVAVTARTATGVELVQNDGSVRLVPASYVAPNANRRIDVIWVRPQFTQYTDAGNTPVFGVTQGAPDANPTKPAIPAGALEIAFAEVKSTDTVGSTVIITQTVPYTALARGMVTVRNQAERLAWAPADGALVYQLDDGCTYQRVGNWFFPVASPWVDYSPVWSALSSPPSVGNGSLTASYRYVGLRAIEVKMLLSVGSSTSGGAGEWGFTLPPGLTTAAVEQIGTAKAYIPGLGGNVVGVSVAPASSFVMRALMPTSPSNGLSLFTRNADSAAAAGTGIPNVPGAYPYAAGANFALDMTLRLA